MGQPRQVKSQPSRRAFHQRVYPPVSCEERGVQPPRNRRETDAVEYEPANRYAMSGAVRNAGRMTDDVH